MAATIAGDLFALTPAPRPARLRPESAPNLVGPSTPADGGPPLTPAQAWPIEGHTTFREILHALNPLQHLPVIGTIYRAITGDTIQPAFRVLGSLLSGGPIGAIGTAVACLAEDMWHRGWNQPGGLMPLSYSASAEAAIPPQASLVPAAAPDSEAPAPSPTPSILATTAPFDRADSPDLASGLARALSAYANTAALPAASGAAWQPTVAG